MYIPKKSKRPIRRVCPICQGEKVVLVLGKNDIKTENEIKAIEVQMVNGRRPYLSTKYLNETEAITPMPAILRTIPIVIGLPEMSKYVKKSGFANLFQFN